MLGLLLAIVSTFFPSFWSFLAASGHTSQIVTNATAAAAAAARKRDPLNTPISLCTPSSEC